MDNTIFTNVKKLYDYELYSEVISLSSILQTAFKNDRTILTPEQEYQLLLFLANSYFIGRKYNSAMIVYREAMQTKKSLIRMKNQQITTIEQNYEHFTESETKYRLAICMKEIQQPKKAIIALQSIKNRTPKMNMLLAKLQQYNGTDNVAIQAYKDVLVECPLALDAIKSLLEIGMNGIEVNSIVVNICSSPQCSDWLSSWIKGHDRIYCRKLNEAAETFKSINQNSKIRNNEKLLTLIGESLYYAGNSDSALIYLSNANTINPYMTDGIMALAVLLAKKNKVQELEKLATPSIQMSEYQSEHWFVIAQHLHSEEKHDKAFYFIQKSIMENPRNVEAYILKGKILYHLRKYNVALMCLKEAQGMANYRFEIFKGLTHCFMAMSRIRNAQTIAAHSVRYFKTSPRSFVLLAKSLLFSKDVALGRRAKLFLEKALEIDESYLPAVQTLAETLQAEGNTSEAIKLLRKQVAMHPNCKLFSMLGDLLSSEKDMDGALDYYTIALNMDPNNSQALAGLNSIGNPTRTGNKPNDTSYVASASLDNTEPNNTENPSFEMMYEISPTGDVESESETFWSDIDAELNQ